MWENMTTRCWLLVQAHLCVSWRNFSFCRPAPLGLGAHGTQELLAALSRVSRCFKCLKEVLVSESQNLHFAASYQKRPCVSKLKIRFGFSWYPLIDDPPARLIIKSDQDWSTPQKEGYAQWYPPIPSGNSSNMACWKTAQSLSWFSLI